jgi:phosphoglycerol transferase
MWTEISSYWVSSDALGTYNWINVMHEEGWIPPMPFYSHRLNFPEGLYLYSAPIIDSLQVSGLRVLRLFIESPLAVYNIYFILGAGFVCASMAFVALALGFSFPYAFGAGLLYSALPFAFERLHHLFLSAYYDVPVGIFLALSLASNISTRKAVALSVLLGVSGLYYPFFSCSFISTAAVALLIKNWRSKDWVAIKKIGRNYLLAVVPCVLVIFLEALPTFLGTMKYGSSGGMTRSPNESLVWGLRFTNMTLPPTTHPWGLYDWVRPLFFSQSYLQEESIYEGFNEYIGIFALLGLAIGIYGLVRRKSIFQESALLSIGGIWFTLLGLRYGLGYLFALTVSPQIRSYNRVSIFIAAIGILLFFGWLNQQKRIPVKFQWPVTLLVLILGNY